MKTLVCLLSLLLLPTAAFAQREVRIQDLTATAESGLTPDEVRNELRTTSSATYPGHITGGDYPSVYTGSNNPNSVTAGDIPNAMTRGNYPSRYTTGFLLEESNEDSIPMPNLNF